MQMQSCSGYNLNIEKQGRGYLYELMVYYTYLIRGISAGLNTRRKEEC